MSRTIRRVQRSKRLRYVGAPDFTNRFGHAPTDAWPDHGEMCRCPRHA